MKNLVGFVFSLFCLLDLIHLLLYFCLVFLWVLLWSLGFMICRTELGGKFILPADVFRFDFNNLLRVELSLENFKLQVCTHTLKTVNANGNNSELVIFGDIDLHWTSAFRFVISSIFIYGEILCALLVKNISTFFFLHCIYFCLYEHDHD